MPAARPILFSAPMVRALLDGRKTQTRRIIKPQPKSRNLGYINADGGAIQCGPDYPDGDEDFVKCPYGRPGDLLWVRETFWQWGVWKKNGKTKTGRQKWKFKPLQQGLRWPLVFTPPTQKPKRTEIGFHKRPSIFLPQSANRLTLEISEVRVQPLQDINDADAIREGINVCSTGLPPGSPPVYGYETTSGDFDEDMAAYQPRDAFKGLWQSINGPPSWDANPWVWVLSFKVYKCNVGLLHAQKAA